LLLAVTTITVGGRADYQYSANTYFFYAPLFIPIVILGVPIVDTAFSVVRRVARGRSVAIADKDHLHHRLMRMGHGPRRTVVILWLWTALLSGLALVPAYTNEGNALVPFGVMALALLLYALFFPGRHDVPADLELDLPEAKLPSETGAPVEATADVVDLESRRRGAG
jgi:UDP-GlcNAc:undecaprenyl-phosphate GlcNAc-1-phosphate transferase